MSNKHQFLYLCILVGMTDALYSSEKDAYFTSFFQSHENSQESSYQDEMIEDMYTKEEKKVLILSHKGLDPFIENKSLKNISQTLGIPSQNIAFMIPSNKKSPRDNVPHLVYLNNYRNDIEFHQKIAKLRNEFPFTHIVPLSENDVLRASRVRGEYKLPGMREKECLFFRDKLAMIKLIKKAGFKVPKSKGIKNFQDFDNFTKKNKKIIVKPVAGVSGKDTWVIQDEQSFNDITQQPEFSQHFQDSSTGQNSVLIAQEFIDSPMFHIDGFFDHTGKVTRSWPCLYSCPPLLLNQGHVVSSRLLEDGPFARYLNQYAKKVVCNMASNITTSGVFHLEGFYDPSLAHMTDFVPEESFDKIIFCEIAARPGGFTIPAQWEKSFGINLISETIKMNIGMESLESISCPKLSMGVITPWKSNPESSNTGFVLRSESEENLWEFHQDMVNINTRENIPNILDLKRACSLPEKEQPKENFKNLNFNREINSQPI